MIERILTLLLFCLQAQNDNIAGWSDNINKIKSVLVRCLVETEYLDHFKSTTSIPFPFVEELEQGIRENNGYRSASRHLIAFVEEDREVMLKQS